MFPVGQEKHENGSCSQAGDGCSTYVLHRHEGGLLHDFAFQYGGRKMSGITAQGIHILRETSDMVLLPMVERIGTPTPSSTETLTPYARTSVSGLLVT